MKRLLLILVALPAFSQVPWRASATATVASSGTYVFTIQQGGTNAQQISSAVISCGTSTFTVAQAQNGTAATATAVTQTISGTLASSANGLVALSPAALSTPLTVNVFRASDVGAGTAVTGAVPFSGTAVLGPSPGRSYIAVLASTQTSQNYSFTITNTGVSSCSMVIDVYGVQAQ